MSIVKVNMASARFAGTCNVKKGFDSHFNVLTGSQVFTHDVSTSCLRIPCSEEISDPVTQTTINLNVSVTLFTSDTDGAYNLDQDVTGSASGKLKWFHNDGTGIITISAAGFSQDVLPGTTLCVLNLVRNDGTTEWIVLGSSPASAAPLFLKVSGPATIDLTPADSGTQFFVNTEGGLVTFNLPEAASTPDGVNYSWVKTSGGNATDISIVAPFATTADDLDRIDARITTPSLDIFQATSLSNGGVGGFAFLSLFRCTHVTGGMVAGSAGWITTNSSDTWATP